MHKPTVYQIYEQGCGKKEDTLHHAWVSDLVQILIVHYSSTEPSLDRLKQLILEHSKTYYFHHSIQFIAIRSKGVHQSSIIIHNTPDSDR